MHPRQTCRAALVALPFFLLAAPASAHHVMGGRLPATLLEGLLSGLGHPVVGPEHLGFLVAVALIVGACGLSLLLPTLFVAAMAAGAALHVSGVGVPAAGILVALSTLLIGLLIACGRTMPATAWAALFAIAGLVHGYAFGEAIYGAQPAPLGAYLAGLVVVQSALVSGIALLVRRAGARISGLAPRLAGAAVCGIGFAVLVGQVIPGP
jgi:urease accessory protein